MSNSGPLDNFIAYSNRLDAFHADICEASNTLKESIRQLSREMALIQLIVIADAYRVDITTLLLKTHPKYLRESPEKLDYGSILDYGSWDVVFDIMISTEVDRRTGRAYGAWIDNLKKELQLKIKVDIDDKLRLEEIIATRNILVHHQGRVDQEYIRRSKDCYGKMKQAAPALGTQRTITNEYYIQATQCFRRVIESIDKGVVTML